MKRENEIFNNKINLLKINLHREKEREKKTKYL
jgi:hypothetical protein